MYLEHLSDKVWLTRNARFTAARRMKRSQVGSTAAVALLSASVIAINLLVFRENISDDSKTLITIGTIVLSTFSLTMSLLIALLRYEWREDNYNQCGMALEELNQKIRIRIDELTHGGKGTEEIASPKEDNLYFLGEYTKILQRHKLNHTIFDYKYGRLSDSKMNQSRYTKVWMHIRYYLLDVWVLYWLIALVPLVLTAYLFILI